MLPTLLDWMDDSIGSDDVAVKQTYLVSVMMINSNCQMKRDLHGCELLTLDEDDS